MKKKIIASLLMVSAFSANAAVIDFEDRPDASTLLADGYAGLDWNNGLGDMYTVNGNTLLEPTLGYNTLANALDGDKVGVNGFGHNPVFISALVDNTFDFNSFWIASAFDTKLTLTFTGWLDGTQLHSHTFDAFRSSATFVELNWLGVDQIRIADQGLHFAIDNITIDAPSAVPEPATAFMFAPALLLCLGLRRRAKQA